MLETIKKQINARAEKGIVPEPLTADQTTAVTALLEKPPVGEEDFLVELIETRVPPGVDAASKVKAEFLYAIAEKQKTSPLISPAHAVKLLGTMAGGYNVLFLAKLLENNALAPYAAEALAKTVLALDVLEDVMAKANTSQWAKNVVDSWAQAQWFTRKPPVPEAITGIIFKVDGEINTDDLSPASEAWSRPDIPLHALSMLRSRVDKPLETIARLKASGHPVIFTGDVVGTGSSRKSATNSVLWHVGKDIPYVPNKRQGGVVLGGKIAPIFFNTLEDAGALPVECDVTGMKTGDVITIYPYEGRIVNTETGAQVSAFKLKTPVLMDEVRAGGRIPLITGRTLTEKVREIKGLGPSDIFQIAPVPEASGQGYTLAQKIVGRACGTAGVRPFAYCEPVITTVGSQDTTGPMTRDELKELACLEFSADLVMQSFCHTAAYPKQIDIKMHETLPGFMSERKGVALKPGDGVIHSWLNRMILPDTVGTGGDSHTRFPIGISFPAGSGLVAYGAAMGLMPLDMPESVLVRFTGQMQPGITLRDLVNAIPYQAIQKGLLTVEKEGKKNVFSGRILEIEGLDHLSVDQAFELTDSSAERSAAACTIKLGIDAVSRYLASNVALLDAMVKEGYKDPETLIRRRDKMKAWLDKPSLLEADHDATYAEVIEIDMSAITEPILACPNDPDDVKLLSDVQGTPIDTVFIGSCMTNIGHFRAAAALLENRTQLPANLWITPPTRMDADMLKKEGLYNTYCRAGARVEIPGCSLCMGNQARVADNASVISTSTRNFPDRIGDNASVFLGSAELAAISAILGKLPTPQEYMSFVSVLQDRSDEIYRYLAFNH